MRLEADIAGIRVALAGPETWLTGALGDRYRAFPPRLGSAPARIAVELVDHRENCPAEGWPEGPALQASIARGDAPDYPVEIGHDGNLLEVASLYLRGWLDLEKESGSATACSRDAIGAVENYFRVAVSHLLLPLGGFLLHAAAVEVDGGAIVAFGESGAGKSTLAALAGKRAVISDDLVAISRDAGGRLVVIPAPFRPGGALARPEGHPVRGLYRLRQTSGLTLAKVGQAAGAAALVASMPFVLDRERSATVALALAEAAAADPGIHELGFAPVPGVWDELEKRLG